MELDGEQFTQFVKEQSGLVKFYGSLLVSLDSSRGIRRGVESPLGVEMAWQLVADVLNLKATEVASAVVITEIITVRLISSGVTRVGGGTLSLA